MQNQLHPCLRRTLRTRATEAAESRLFARLARIQTVVHVDDKRHGLASGDEVIHDDTRLALRTPARLVLTHAVLQIEHGELLRGICVILVGQIDVSVTHLTGHR